MTIDNATCSRWRLLRQRLDPRVWGAANAPPPNAARWSKPRPRILRYRVIILLTIAALLVWEVFTRSIVAYLADAAPQVAIRLRSTNPTALLNLADTQLNSAAEPLQTSHQDAVDTTSLGETKGPSSDPNTGPSNPNTAPRTEKANAQIRSWAELALLNDPLNARAFRILGQLTSDNKTDNKKTDAFMQAAVRRSLLESVAVYWMMLKSYQDRDFSGTLRYANVLLRTRPLQSPALVMPLLGKIAETPDASDQLKQLLASNPPWRSQFFSDLSRNISDARTPLDVMLSLKDTSNPVTAEDLGPYLKFLLEHDFYDLAYYTWLQFLPPEQLVEAGQLFNGGYEVIPSGLPFDWVFNNGPGVTVKIAPRTDQLGQHALFLNFGPGRVDFDGVNQLIMLAPGTYKFRGKYQADLVSERGLEWRINCAGSQDAMIGQSEAVTGSTPSWKELEFSFTVPDASCPAQYVSLIFDARSASEQFISGSIWYDDLQILREAIAKAQE